MRRRTAPSMVSTMQNNPPHNPAETTIVFKDSINGAALAEGQSLVVEQPSNRFSE